MEEKPWKYYGTHKKYSEEKLDMMAHQYEIRLAGMRKYQQKKYHTDDEYKKYCQGKSKEHYQKNKELLAEKYIEKKKEVNDKKWEQYNNPNVKVIVSFSD